MILQLAEVVIEPRVRGMCRLPYPLHPKGCPNFSHKPGCPPACPIFSDRFDLSAPAFAVVNAFDLAAHVERMRAKHPDWTSRQLECCLYWQPTARRQLSAEVGLFLWKHAGYEVDACPEAGGVNVTETLRRAGVELEWPPRRIVRQVAIAAKPAVVRVNAGADETPRIDPEKLKAAVAVMEASGFISPQDAAVFRNSDVKMSLTSLHHNGGPGSV